MLISHAALCGFISGKRSSASLFPPKFFQLPSSQYGRSPICLLIQSEEAGWHHRQVLENSYHSDCWDSMQLQTSPCDPKKFQIFPKKLFPKYLPSSASSKAHLCQTCRLRKRPLGFYCWNAPGREQIASQNLAKLCILDAVCSSLKVVWPLCRELTPRASSAHKRDTRFVVTETQIQGAS